MSEYDLLSIDCTQITSDETYETYETGNKEHYINIQGKDKIYMLNIIHTMNLSMIILIE